jgi:hypothetical protein
MIDLFFSLLVRKRVFLSHGSLVAKTCKIPPLAHGVCASSSIFTLDSIAKTRTIRRFVMHDFAFDSSFRFRIQLVEKTV